MLREQRHPYGQSGVAPEDRVQLREAHNKRVDLFTALRNADSSVKTWDVVVLLVQDAEQKQQFEEDLVRREKMGKIPPTSKYHVLADSRGGLGVVSSGNGGAIINALMVLSTLYTTEELDTFKVRPSNQMLDV
jgi:hypothetical protein